MRKIIDIIPVRQEQSKASRQPCPKVIDAPKYLRAMLPSDMLSRVRHNVGYVYIIIMHNVNIQCVLRRKQRLSQPSLTRTKSYCY